MRVGFEVSGVIALLLVGFWIMNKALCFVSVSNDVGVVVGVIILLMLIAAGVNTTLWGAKRIKKYYTERKEEK